MRVTKREYSYPPDEFDRLAGAVTHGAAHRARKSRWRAIVPFLLALVLGGVLAYGVIWALPKFANFTPSQLASSVGIAPTPTAPAGEATPTPEKTTAKPDETTAAPTPKPEKTTATPTPTPEKTEKPVTVDRSTAIRVLNATRTQGLAGKGVSALNQDGWTNAAAGNYTGGTVNRSTVFYKSSDNAAAAKEIAKTLGISQVTLSESLRGPVSVVLAADFRP